MCRYRERDRIPPLVTFPSTISSSGWQKKTAHGISPKPALTTGRNPGAKWGGEADRDQVRFSRIILGKSPSHPKSEPALPGRMARFHHLLLGYK